MGKKQVAVSLRKPPPADPDEFVAGSADATHIIAERARRGGADRRHPRGRATRGDRVPSHRPRAGAVGALRGARSRREQPRRRVAHEVAVDRSRKLKDVWSARRPRRCLRRPSIRGRARAPSSPGYAPGSRSGSSRPRAPSLSGVGRRRGVVADDVELDAPVVPAACVGRVVVDRPVGTEALRREAGRVDAVLDEPLHDRLGAVLAEGAVDRPRLPALSVCPSMRTLLDLRVLARGASPRRRARPRCPCPGRSPRSRSRTSPGRGS